MSDQGRDFERAVNDVYPALVRSAHVLCWSHADVEDVVQETMLQALRGFASFRGNSSPLTWCYAILARVAAGANRQRRRAPTGCAASVHADGLPPIDEAMIRDETARLMVDAIRGLPERQREVLTLHFLQDLSYAEIGDALGVAVGTVKATVHAAKASLRKTLAAGELRPR
jgi:RNA polymerase sigma-70 factor (ECF subfamily)